MQSWRTLEYLFPHSPNNAPLPPFECHQEAKFARQKEIALERERKAALMDYLFSHGTKEEPLKQTEIGEIPESWKPTRVGDLIKLKVACPDQKIWPTKLLPDLNVPVYGGNGVLGYTSRILVTGGFS